MKTKNGTRYSSTGMRGEGHRGTSCSQVQSGSRKIIVGSERVLSVIACCVVIIVAGLLGARTSHGSGIFEVVTPHPGTALADCLTQAKASTDSAGPWTDILFSNDEQRQVFISSTMQACWDGIGGPGGSWSFSCGGYARSILVNPHWCLRQAPGTVIVCGHVGESIRLMSVGGTWDPATYDTTIIYVPDLSFFADKNAGAPPAGMCDMSAVGGQGMR